MALRHRIVNFKVAKVNKHKVILYYHHKKKKRNPLPINMPGKYPPVPWVLGKG